MGQRALGSSLAIAIVAHGAGVVGIHALRADEASRRDEASRVPSTVTEIAIAIEPPPASTAVSVAAHETSRAIVGSHVRRSTEPTSAGARVDEGAEPSREASPIATAPIAILAAPASSVDLATGSYWKIAALSPSAERATELDRDLRTEQATRDRAIGLGPEGALVAAAHEAASPSVAPDVGEATFEIELDASGALTGVTLESASPDVTTWSAAKDAIARAVAAKSVRLRPGTSGLRVRLRVLAERKLPAGDGAHVNAGNLSDDVCSGKGLARRCANGSPVGASGTFGDLSNIGARRSRVVHVQVLSSLGL